MSVAIIPARGGSKRIPRKNIKQFHGKPMIAWSIEAALTSKQFDRVIVSTDDNEIAEIALTYGAEIPFMRPAELANDHAATIPVVKHAILELESQNIACDHVCCIYATAPFVSPSDLVNAHSMLLTELKLDYVFSCAEYSYPVQRALTMDKQGRMAMLNVEHAQTRSQDLQPAYHDAGQFYWGKRDAFIEERPIFSSHSSGFLLNRWQVQDIDTLDDWDMAEKLFELNCS